MSTKIQGSDTIMDMTIKMSGGNPGSMNIIMQIFNSDDIDPDNIMGGVGVMLHLDSMGIYGTDIYILYNDICDRDLVMFLAVIRATQLGFFDRTILKDACKRQDGSGKALVPTEELYLKVKAQLPKFNSINAVVNKI